ncbi:hypothetical protein SANTM175S_00763 [Streptomyces antimycoticus]
MSTGWSWPEATPRGFVKALVGDGVRRRYSPASALLTAHHAREVAETVSLYGGVGVDVPGLHGPGLAVLPGLGDGDRFARLCFNPVRVRGLGGRAARSATEARHQWSADRRGRRRASASPTSAAEETGDRAVTLPATGAGLAEVAALHGSLLDPVPAELKLS